jgi:hypothetical protein
MSSNVGRFAMWATSTDAAICAALEQLACAVLACQDAAELTSLEQRLVRFGSSVSSQADVVRRADADAKAMADEAKNERNRKARERRTQKLLDTPLSELIASKMNRRRVAAKST